jgi:hypothetical protein
MKKKEKRSDVGPSSSEKETEESSSPKKKLTLVQKMAMKYEQNIDAQALPLKPNGKSS